MIAAVKPRKRAAVGCTGNGSGDDLGAWFVGRARSSSCSTANASPNPLHASEVRASAYSVGDSEVAVVSLREIERYRDEWIAKGRFYTIRAARKRGVRTWAGKASAGDVRHKAERDREIIEGRRVRA